MLLALVVSAWVGARMVLWEPLEVDLPDRLSQTEGFPQTGSGSRQSVELAGPDAPVVAVPPAFASGERERAPIDRLPMLRPAGRVQASASDWVTPNRAQTRNRAFAPVGHHAMFLAAMRYSPVPVVAPPGAHSSRARSIPSLQSFAPVGPVERPHSDRWSLAAWAFWRQGSDAEAVSLAAQPSYGASQIGGALDFRLDPRSRRDPRLYFRAYKAINGASEAELSFGVSVKPLPAIPLRGHVELRHAQRENSREIRAGVFATTELPRVSLPLDLSGELYAQAGLVTGEFETVFVDAQAVATREVTEFDLGALSAGAGAWLGAQRGAHRIDVGPTLRLDIDLGATLARLSLDWRERVAGEAAPASGLAATISTQF